MMTGEQIRMAKQLARQIANLADIAERNNVVLGNGGDVSSMLGAMATDIEQQADTAAKDPAVIAAGKAAQELRDKWQAAINRQRNLRHWSVVHALQDDGPDATVNYAAL